MVRGNWRKNWLRENRPLLFSVVRFIFFVFVPLLPFKEGVGVVAFDLINLKDKNEVESQNLTTPSPSLTTGGGQKHAVLRLAIF